MQLDKDLQQFVDELQQAVAIKPGWARAGRQEESNEAQVSRCVLGQQCRHSGVQAATLGHRHPLPWMYTGGSPITIVTQTLTQAQWQGQHATCQLSPQ